MNFESIKAIVIRHYYVLFRDINRIFGIFYWPIINLSISGMSGVWFDYYLDSNLFIFKILACVVFWEIVLKVNFGIGNTLMSELFDHSLVNIFSTPLKLSEWIIGTIILTIIDGILVFSFTSILVWLLFGLNVFTLGFLILPFAASVMIFAWSIGFFVCGIIITYGKRSIEPMFAISWIFGTLCAVYFPLNLMPYKIQVISKLFPITYTFESIRMFFDQQVVNLNYILISFGLNFIYLLLAILFFALMFKKAKIRGLASLN